MTLTVIKPGILSFRMEGGESYAEVSCWHFGGTFDDGALPGDHAHNAQMFRAALQYIATESGFKVKFGRAPAEPITEPKPEDFDAQRKALEAISRWRDE